MPQNAEAEEERGPDSPSPTDVELETWADGDNPNSTNIRFLSIVPLPEGQIRDLMAFPRESLREVPVPALGSAHGVGVEAVVDDANAHRHEINGRVRGPPEGEANLTDRLVPVLQNR